MSRDWPVKRRNRKSELRRGSSALASHWYVQKYPNIKILFEYIGEI